MHWFDPGSKICINEKLGKFKETKETKIIADKHSYFVNDRHPILFLKTLFKGGINAIKEAKKVVKIVWIVNIYQDCCCE